MTAFITGCTSGFGRALALRLLSLGHEVIGTAPPDAPIQLPVHPRFTPLLLDLSDADTITAATDVGLARGVELLVNNAGYAVFGSQEELDPEVLAQLLMVNVVGHVRVTRALLPSLRQRGGTVVQLSSVAGRTVFPESGFYAATKYAMEAISEALYQETCGFGMRVRVVEPGSFDTGFLPTAQALSPPPPASSPYAQLRELWDARKLELLEAPQDPARVAQAILDSLDDPRPFMRVVVGADAERMLSLRDALGPDRWSRLAGDRAGDTRAHVGDEVLSPAEVVSLWLLPSASWTPDQRAAVAATRQALSLHHLDHWVQTEVGRQALLLLGA